MIPQCQVKGCCNPAQNVRRADNPYYRRSKEVRAQYNVIPGFICAGCYGKIVAAKHGLKSMSHVIAKNAGFESHADYINSTHPYRRHRKDYCENTDGRLGFICTTTIMISAQLEVDHIDGNPTHNDPINLQTLCGCCHTYKTLTNEDYATPGRKKLKVV